MKNIFQGEGFPDLCPCYFSVVFHNTKGIEIYTLNSLVSRILTTKKQLNCTLGRHSGIKQYLCITFMTQLDHNILQQEDIIIFKKQQGADITRFFVSKEQSLAMQLKRGIYIS